MVLALEQTQTVPMNWERRNVTTRGPGCLLSQLADARPLVRRWGVRDLAGYPKSVKILLSHLVTETDDGVREVIFATLGSTGGKEVITGLLALLGSDDANLRNGALEVLCQQAGAVLPHLSSLLTSSNPDLRLAGVEIIRATSAGEGRPLLVSLLASEKDIRVVSQLLIGLGEQGSGADIPLLQKILGQFPDTPFLKFAGESAIRQLAVPLVPLREREQLTAEEWSRFRDFLRTNAALDLPEAERDEAEEVITDVARRHQADSMRALLDSLARPEEQEAWHLLLDRLFPKPNHFFHSLPQLRCLAGPVLTEIQRIRPRGGKIRLWCHSNSAGTEPYSVALALAEYFADYVTTPIHLVASEGETAAMEQAQQGIYSEAQVNDLPGVLRDRYFVPLDEGMALREDIRQQVAFRLHDLAGGAVDKSFREFDVIICRDFLSRLDPMARRRAAILFLDALHPGGFLILGMGETMSRISGLFRVRNYGGLLVFQKPLV